MAAKKIHLTKDKETYLATLYGKPRSSAAVIGICSRT